MYNLYRVSNLAVWLQQINKLYLLKFWRRVQKMSNNTATNFASCVGGCSGVDDVTQIMWKQQFDALCNKSVDSRFRSVFEDKWLINCLILVE